MIPELAAFNFNATERSNSDNNHILSNVYESSNRTWNSTKGPNLPDGYYRQPADAQFNQARHDKQSNRRLEFTNIFADVKVEAETQLLKTRRIDHSNREEIKLIYEGLAEKDEGSSIGDVHTQQHLGQVNKNLQVMGVELVVYKDEELVKRAQDELLKRNDYYSDAISVMALRDLETGKMLGEPIIITRPRDSRSA